MLLAESVLLCQLYLEQNTTCMKAQGTFDPPSGQRSPLGQNTSGFVLTCFLIQSAEQGKQNLWWGAVGHCTKCVSSRRCAQIVHFSRGLFGIASASEVMVLLNIKNCTNAAAQVMRKDIERKCYIEEAWRCSWSFLYLELALWLRFCQSRWRRWPGYGWEFPPALGVRGLTIEVRTLERQHRCYRLWRERQHFVGTFLNS